MIKRFEGVCGALGRLLTATALCLGAAPAAWALDVTVTATNDRAQPGEPVFFRIVVANRDGTTRNNVQVSAVTPADISLSGGQARPAASCPGGACTAGETATWNLASLPAGASFVIDARYLVAGGATDGTVINLPVEVTHDGSGTPDSASRAVAVDSTAALRLSIAAEDQLVAPGDRAGFEVSFGNVGVNAVGSPTSLELRASVPVGTTVVADQISDGGSLDDGGTPADPSDDAVVWNLGILEAAAGGKRSFEVTVPGAAADAEVLVSEASLNTGGPARSRTRTTSSTT